MGLDISFNLNQAKQAGLAIEKVQNGIFGDAQQALEEGDTAYAQWLMEESTVVYIPGTDHTVYGDISADNIVIRANKWGSIYAPLVKFLMINNIKWDEF